MGIINFFKNHFFILMAKFLKLPVTNEQNQLISADGILIVEQATQTTTTIAYAAVAATGDIITITHADVGAGSEAMRDYIQNQLVYVHQRPWWDVAPTLPTPTYAISGIALA